MPQSNEPHIRRAARVIRMVGELHRMGYQRLRIMPYLSGLNTYRVEIGPVERFSPRNGAWMRDSTTEPWAGYTSASDDRYFDWPDASGNTARQLADKFVARFPELCRAGEGRDWNYAGWLADLEGALERMPSRLPIVAEEYMEIPPEEMNSIPLRSFDERAAGDDGSDKSFPLPPPGTWSA